jgi:sulfur-carrier protein adenylyltransferase/sulfurtransferase
MPLTPEEQVRYHRQIQLPEVGQAGQERLKAARVLVVGAGGLGCSVLQYLAAAGVGTLGFADADRVESSNLPRQPLYGPADVGAWKVEAAVAALHRLNELVSYQPHRTRVNRANVLALVEAYDVIVDCSDNFPTRYLLNDACVSANRPLVSGAIYRFEGQVSVFNFAGGPTYRCLFPTPPGAAEVPDCNTTGVLNVLPGLIGLAQATEVLKVLTGIGEALCGRLWLFDALTFQTRQLRFNRHPERSRLNLETADPGDYESPNVCEPLAELATIAVVELRALLAASAPPFLLDVREPVEYAQSHLPNAFLLPLNQLASRAAVDIPRDYPVVVYCQSGARSAQAVRLLQNLGFNNVRNLLGGFGGLS